MPRAIRRDRASLEQQSEMLPQDPPPRVVRWIGVAAGRHVRHGADRRHRRPGAGDGAQPVRARAHGRRRPDSGAAAGGGRARCNVTEGQQVAAGRGAVRAPLGRDQIVADGADHGDLGPPDQSRQHRQGGGLVSGSVERQEERAGPGPPRTRVPPAGRRHQTRSAGADGGARPGEARGARPRSSANNWTSRRQKRT